MVIYICERTNNIFGGQLFYARLLGHIYFVNLERFPSYQIRNH